MYVHHVNEFDIYQTEMNDRHSLKTDLAKKKKSGWLVVV